MSGIPERIRHLKGEIRKKEASIAKMEAGTLQRLDSYNGERWRDVTAQWIERYKRVVARCKAELASYSGA